LKLKEWKKMEGEAWGAPSSKEEDDADGVQHVGVKFWHPPVKLRRGGGASMMKREKMKLLHGLGLERERGV
jgi:hypothetical protein